MFWASQDLQKNTKSQVIFVLGAATNQEQQLEVEKESVEYGDILQGWFPEHYNLLVYKSLLFLSWSRSSCSSTPWIAKTDDDVVFDLVVLQDAITAANHSTFNCLVGKNLPVARRGDKWSVPYSEFPDDYWPDYCIGVFYYFTKQVRDSLLSTVSSMRSAGRLDDAWTTGVLARAAGIQHSPVYNIYDQEINKNIFDKFQVHDVAINKNTLATHVPTTSLEVVSLKTRLWMFLNKLDNL